MIRHGDKFAPSSRPAPMISHVTTDDGTVLATDIEIGTISGRTLEDAMREILRRKAAREAA